MTLDQVPEQDGMKVFLVDLDPQVPVEADDFRESPGFPELLECLLDGKSPLRRERSGTVDAFVIQKLPERKWEYLLSERTSTHLRRDFPGKHPGRRAR